MSNQIETAFVKKFHDSLKLLTQQMDSRLSSGVSTDTFVGEEGFWDRIGEIDPQVAAGSTGNPATTVISNTPHDRRKAVFTDYELADWVRPQDLHRLLIDPKGGYLRAFAAGFNRKKDEVIRDAFFADVGTGKTGSTTVSFPGAATATHNVDTGNTAGLTFEKLLEAKRLLLQKDVPQDSEFHVAITAVQLEELLLEEETKSKDYGFSGLLSADTAGIQGFLGINYHLYNGLDTGSDGSNVRRMIPMWVKDGMALHIPEDMFVDIGPRRDKSMANQLYARMSIGATRMEEDKVVRIYCTE